MPALAIVTGASSGIGRAVCERLLADGLRVAGIARDFRKFPCRDGRFTAIEIDLADVGKLPERLRALAEEHPGATAIVCAAGLGLFGSLEEFSPEEIARVVQVNFLAHALLVRAFIPRMKRAGKGDIVFIGSEAALEGHQKGSIYCATKFAVRGFAQSLREECSRAGVRVSLINPGLTRTPFFDRLDFAPGEAEENFLEPEDIARAVAAILSARPGTVFDEINLSPLKKVIRFGKGKK